MPTRIVPRSHDARAQLLKRAIKSASDDQRAGNNFVPQAWIDAADSFIKVYQPKVDAINVQTGQRATRIQQRETAIERLALWTRHSQQVLKLRTERLGHPDGILRTYGLPIEGAAPRHASADEWLDAARKFIAGDALAVQQGYPPMSNPSAAELQVQWDAARIEVDQISAADERVDRAQAQAADDSARADELLTDLVDYVEFGARKLDTASQRRVLRRYGFKFSYKPGETPDAEDEAASTPTPEPPPTTAAA